MQYGVFHCYTFSDARQLERPLPLQMIPLEAVGLLVDLLIPRLCIGVYCGHGCGKALCMLDEALLLLPQELCVARKVADARADIHLRLPPSGGGGRASDDPDGRRLAGGHSGR